MSHERIIEIVRIRSEQGAARRGRVIEEYRIGKTSRIDYIVCSAHDLFLHQTTSRPQRFEYNADDSYRFRGSGRKRERLGE